MCVPGANLGQALFQRLDLRLDDFAIAEKLLPKSIVEATRRGLQTLRPRELWLQ